MFTTHSESQNDPVGSSQILVKETEKETQENNQELSSSDEANHLEARASDAVQIACHHKVSVAKKTETTLEVLQNESGVMKKVPFKQGWSREEHIR